MVEPLGASCVDSWAYQTHSTHLFNCLRALSRVHKCVCVWRGRVVSEC